MENRGSGIADGLQSAPSEVRDEAIISIQREDQIDDISEQTSPPYAVVCKVTDGPESDEVCRVQPPNSDTESMTGRNIGDGVFVYPELGECNGEDEIGTVESQRHKSSRDEITAPRRVELTSASSATESTRSNRYNTAHVTSLSSTSDVIVEGNYTSTVKESNTVLTPSESFHESIRTISLSSSTGQTRNGPRDDGVHTEISSAVYHSIGKRRSRNNMKNSTLQNFYDDGFLDAMKRRTKKQYSRRRKKYLTAIIALLFVILLLIVVVIGLLLYSNGTFGHHALGTDEGDERTF